MSTTQATETTTPADMAAEILLCAADDLNARDWKHLYEVFIVGAIIAKGQMS